MFPMWRRINSVWAYQLAFVSLGFGRKLWRLCVWGYISFCLGRMIMCLKWGVRVYEVPTATCPVWGACTAWSLGVGTHHPSIVVAMVLWMAAAHRARPPGPTEQGPCRPSSGICVVARTLCSCRLSAVLNTLHFAVVPTIVVILHHVVWQVCNT